MATLSELDLNTRSNDTAIIPGDKQTGCHKPPQTQQGLLCLTLRACVFEAFGSSRLMLCTVCSSVCAQGCSQITAPQWVRLWRQRLHRWPCSTASTPSYFFFFFFFWEGGVFKHNLKRTLYCKLNQFCGKKNNFFVDCAFVFTLDPRDSSCCNKTIDNGAKVTEFLCKMFLDAAACSPSRLF